MKFSTFITLIFLSSFTCVNSENQTSENPVIICNENGCRGTYSGPEFIKGSDVAHQFSNQMANSVGKHLKALFDQEKYVKVDLKNIKMTTKDMDGIGDVTYSLEIPFVTVVNECEAATALDHRGGWGHKITEESVRKTFKRKNKLELEELTTPEGLQEFWIQWRHESRQVHCK